jgi:hypothetical protein
MDAVDVLWKIGPFVGPSGIFVLLWYLSDRANQRALAAYREDTLAMRAEHDKALVEVRQMYKDNSELVRSYQKIAEGLQDLIVLNTRTITNLCDKVDQNQFCPQVRLKKQATGREDA